MQERDSYSQSMCRLLERSVFSDRMVFVRAAHKSKFMNDTEVRQGEGGGTTGLRRCCTLT